MASGMGGIALGALLAEQGCWRPTAAGIDAKPAAAVRPTRWPRSRRTSPARAKRVLHIFCTGAVSHLDTWDYKPELIKRHGQPMPGRREADHLPGRERQPGPAAPGRSGRGGRAASTSRTCCRTWPSCADDLCFIHSLTSKTNTHGPGEMFMSTGFTLEGFPSIGRLGQLRAGDREPGPAGLRGDPRPAGRPAARAGELDQRLPAGRLPGDGVQRRAGRSTTSARPPEIAPGDDRAARDFLRLLNDEHLKQQPGRHRALGPDRRLRAGRPDAAERPGGRRPVAREPGHAGALRPGRPQPAHGRASAATACSPAGCWSAASGSSRCSTAPSPWARACSTGTATAASSPTTTATARSSTSPPPRC